MFERFLLLDGVHQIFKEDFMKKSVKKFSIVVALLAVVFAFTSCKQLWDSVVEASSLWGKTYVTTVNNTTIKFTFREDLDDKYELGVIVGASSLNNMYWMLDTSSDDEYYPVLIYQGGTTSADVIGKLRPNSYTPTRLTAIRDFLEPIGGVTITANTEFEKQ